MYVTNQMRLKVASKTREGKQIVTVTIPAFLKSQTTTVTTPNNSVQQSSPIDFQSEIQDVTLKTDTVDTEKSRSTPSYFHEASDLSRQPELIGKAPSWFDEHNENVERGVLLLRVLIDARGKVHSISTEKSTIDKATEQEIILQFYNSTYQPGEVNGTPVNSVMYIEVET